MIEFIVNPVSRGTKGAELWSDMEKELADAGLTEGKDYRLHQTTKEERADVIAARICGRGSKPLLLAVLGGDGTLNEVVNGIPENAVVNLVYIPTGTGVDFARSMGIPSDVKLALKQLLHPGYYQKLDYGILKTDQGKTERRFMVSGGIGYDAAVCHKLLYSKVRSILLKMHMTKVGYLLVGIDQVIRSKPMNGTLIIDGIHKISLENARFVSAHIHPFEGGGFCFAPTADPADGKLELCVVNHCSRGKFFLALALSLFRKHMLLPGVSVRRCDTAEVCLTTKFPVHADGESAGVRQRVFFGCRRQQVSIITEK